MSAHDPNEIIYEVSLLVDAEIAERYLPWLKQHVSEMLALPGFIEAQIEQIMESTHESGQTPTKFNVRYRLCDAKALQVYFSEHAQRMRQDGMDRFGGRFSAQRRILKALLD